jgi:hypothetical protein
MPKTRLPRGRHAKRPAVPLNELLPEKLRIQFFIYNGRTQQYHAASSYNLKTIVRDVDELNRLFSEMAEIVANGARWQK